MTKRIAIEEDEIVLSAIRSQGAGGQNVNKVATAIHLRFDIHACSLPDEYKQKLLELKDRRISKEGVIVIKAQKFRTQEKNREEAIKRLRKLIQCITIVPKVRKPTKPSKAAQKRRLNRKKKRGQTKALRGKVF